MALPQCNTPGSRIHPQLCSLLFFNSLEISQAQAVGDSGLLIGRGPCVGEALIYCDPYPNTLKVKVQKVLKCLNLIDATWFLCFKCSSQEAGGIKGK